MRVTRKIFAAGLAAFLLAAPSLAGERINLTVPDQARPGTSTYTLKELNFDWVQEQVVVVLRGTNGVEKTIVYREAEAMIRQLNKANLTVKSLQRRVMEKLIADGHLIGTISGVPG